MDYQYKEDDDSKLQQLRRYARTYPLKILVWGASGCDPTLFEERRRVKDFLNKEHHNAKFSEDFENDPDKLIDPINDEIFQATTMDVVVVLYGPRGTQSEIDRIVMQYPDIAEKSLIIIEEQTKNNLTESLSREGWRDLLANPNKCCCYAQLPLDDHVFNWLKNEIQRKREKKAVDYALRESKAIAPFSQPSLQAEQKTTPNRRIILFPEPSDASCFYEKASILDELSQSPSKEHLKLLLEIIQDDDSLSLYFYGGKDSKIFPDFGWVELLYEAGEFDDMDVLSEEGGLVRRYQAGFIRAAVEAYPETVFDVITSVRPGDVWIQRVFLEALEAMDSDLAEKGLWLIWDYLAERGPHNWHWQGDQAARIMTKFAEDHPNPAFSIARLLLEVWVSDKEDSFDTRGACVRFEGYWYAELIDQYYKQLCERYPYRALKLLVRNLDDYLNEANRIREYDISEHYYISVENIDAGSSWGHQEFVSIYMNALRDCLNHLIEHEPEAIDKTLGLLHACDKAVFTRFEIYILSKIGTERHKDRINEIASTKLFFEYGCYKNEYDLLISKKNELLAPETKQTILGWIENISVDNKDDFSEWFQKAKERVCTEDDIRHFEHIYRAQRLYSIREAFPDEYARYKQLSAASEESLKPRSMHSEVRFIAGDEGTPLTFEQMNAMGVDDAMNYVLTPENYNYQPKDHTPNSPEEALAYVFQQAVKTRPTEFLGADLEKISTLPNAFFSKYFYGLWDALRENKIDRFDWDRYFEVAKAVVDRYKADPEIAPRLKPLIECVQEGFKDINKIDYTVDRLYAIFSIVEPLLSIQEEKSLSNERDPIQVRCNSVTGEALPVCLSLGIVFKKSHPSEFESSFKTKLESVFDRVLTEIKTSWTVCTIGIDFPRIHWLLPEWVEQNLDLILSDENWDTVWGTFLHWGRPSEELFRLLCDKGVYTKAIAKKDGITSRGSDDKPAEELAKHFVSAYFNGWIESYDEPILQTFLQSASDELLGYTARFFTTGFEGQKEEPIEGVNERLKSYWKKRLEVISTAPNEHRKEASELACWIEDCPLDDATAFELTKQSLSLCNGKLKDNFRAVECMKALCSYATRDNRVRAIRSMGLIVNNPPEYMYWDQIQEELSCLLNSVVQDKHASPELIREAMSLADDLGRQRVFRYRGVFEELSQRL